MHVLVTGATGKVGQQFVARLLADPRWPEVRVRALCHNRTLPAQPRLDTVRGSIERRDVVKAALDGITHVVHMATVKEDPQQAMDVSVKGMFWLLEEFRQSPTAKQFMLIGGDCVVGHCMVPYDAPVTETSPRRAYPGVYALSKVLEEVMVEQYQIQYGLNGTILRAPWIMEKDDFRYSLSFGDDLFGGPDWKEMVGPEVARRSRETGAVPLLLEEDGTPLRRNFVHVDDLVAAIVLALTAKAARQRLYNICMDEPVDYARVAEHLARTRNLPATPVRGPYVGNWMDNSRAKAELGWRPAYDLARLIDSAWDYARPPEEPRRVWYPG